LLLAFGLAACQPATESATESAPESATETAAPAVKVDRLSAVLDRQAEDVQARYEYRHPKATLEFFGIEPGMTVVEGLPGRGSSSSVSSPA
jgi:predicted methyltransferase